MLLIEKGVQLIGHPFLSTQPRNRFASRICTMSRPGPRINGGSPPGPDRVQDDIAADFEEMAVLLDENGFIPALEQVTGSTVELIEELRIDAVQLSHA